VPLGVRVRPPVLLFTGCYLMFLAILWLPLAELFPEAFVALTVDRSLFGYKPPVATIVIYLLGLYAVWVGYLYAKAVPARAIVRRVGDEDGQRVHRLWQVGVGVALAAFVIQLVLVGQVPLLAVAARWELNPKLIQLVLWLAALVPMGLLIRGWRRGPVIVAAVSFVALSLLAYRTMVFDLVMAVLVACSLFIPRRRLGMLLVGVGLAVFVVFATVGVITKGQIYGNKGYDITKAVALVQTDSIGTFSNLDRVRVVTEEHGTLRGMIVTDTSLNIIPGVGRDYANFRLGSLLSGRQTITVDGTQINRSVSLTTTFAGPAYADGGYLGVLMLGGILGLLLGIFEEVAVRSRWFAGVFGLWAAVMFHGIYSGFISETGILVTVLTSVAAVIAIRQRAARRTATASDAPAALAARAARRRVALSDLALPAMVSAADGTSAGGRRPTRSRPAPRRG